MKQIIIVLLVIILAAIGYNMYSKYKRFSLDNYEYKTPEMDVANAEKGLLLDYYRAVERVNGHVITQWSVHRIDVRNPKKDNAQTTEAVVRYRELLADVSHFEAQLLHPKKAAVKKELSPEEERNSLVWKMFYAKPSSNVLRLGETSAMVYEIQRLLIAKGDSIQHDGVFRAETFNSLKAFEAANGLFPDGKLDVLTLTKLLK